MRTIVNVLKVMVATLCLVALAACGGGGAGGTVGSGTLRVALTDAPSCGFDQVNITVNKVRVHQSASAGENAAGWSDIEISPPRKINLLDLMNGVLEELGQTSLPAGQYTQVRLVLERNTGGSPANSVVPTGGAEQPLDTPSAVQSGIKLNHTFTVEANKLHDIVLDFDACRSIVMRGNGTFGLKPVIKPLPRTTTGIVGTVDVALAGVVVSAQKGGKVIRATVPNATGEFALLPIDPAASPYDVVITATGRATAVIAAVPVVSDMTTRISTTAAPISLPLPLPPPPLPLLPPPASRSVSGTVTLAPAPAALVMPAAALAEVRALQAVGGVPKVEIAHVNVNETTGAYSLTLPIGAPVLATYAVPLPLTFAPQGGAGQYTIEAAAESYVTQTAAVDLSIADATVDFLLVLAP